MQNKMKLHGQVRGISLLLSSPADLPVERNPAPKTILPWVYSWFSGAWTKIALIIFLATVFSWPVYAQNQPAPSSTIQSILEKVENLKKKIIELTGYSQTASALFFTKNLKMGTFGNEVRSLQEFIANIPGIYPEKIISGYFGRLTQEAVKRLQIKYQIQATGFFGPLTRTRINELLARSKQLPSVLPPIISVSTLATSSPAAVVEKIDTINSKDESLKSSATTTGEFQLQPKPSYDLKILASTTQALINKKREEASLATLLWDDSLARLALEHSQDQANDNIEITNPEFICHYPLIRHEGFISGFTLKDRLANSNISYRSAGENIALLPVGKNFIYEYSFDSPKPVCPKVEDFKSGVDSKEEATRKYNEVLAQAREAVKNLEPIKWVNKEWRTPEEIVQKVVEGWLNSPGHRENIMNPAFNFGGMGVVAVNDYLIFTHEFLGRREAIK